MRLQHVLLTHSGGREENQDYGGVVATANGGWVMAVADGLGGHGGGAVASRLAVQSVLQAAQHQIDFSQQELTNLLQGAQDALHVHQRAETHMNRMRTTLVLLMLRENKALWLHVGDSRLYHFRENRVYFQTKDHSVPQMLVASEDITPQEIRGHPDRNRLLRALGGDEREARATVCKLPIAIGPDDAFLLCTDGFWELVWENEMEQALREAKDIPGWLHAMEEVLLARARDDFDNYTAFGVWIQP